MSVSPIKLLVTSTFLLISPIDKISCNFIHPIAKFSSTKSDSDVLTFINRTEWKALPTTEPLEKLDVIPTPYVMIYHTGTETCFNLEDCAKIVRRLQARYITTYPWDRDIGFNFVISGDGSVYVGRGWDTVGAHTLGANRKSIGIALIGTFYDQSPSANQLFSVVNLIRFGICNNHIAKEFKYYSYPEMSLLLKAKNKLPDINQVVDP
ncbi:peptidoglycan-recognition protein 2-like [Microplitis demolitor]|uniref:peptidoglycan-recognition protein 2-like n=1 Tax=Microplitis demolitor TaxID=69319 RepID=UPI0004CD0660|nr:peptidoglycan-recognition protein 2-like [Microplitis demolitor]